MGFSDPVEQAYGIIYFNVTQQIEDVSAAGVKVPFLLGPVRVSLDTDLQRRRRHRL